MTLELFIIVALVGFQLVTFMRIHFLQQIVDIQTERLNVLSQRLDLRKEVR